MGRAIAGVLLLLLLIAACVIAVQARRPAREQNRQDMTQRQWNARLDELSQILYQIFTTAQGNALTVTTETMEGLNSYFPGGRLPALPTNQWVVTERVMTGERLLVQVIEQRRVGTILPKPIDDRINAYVAAYPGAFHNA